ncbi:MAG TPA: XdhC family protein [Longilinea sp.]|nr:XdhC family protein [Longilinea sp.]
MTIFHDLSEIEQRGESCALCTIISSSGSTPRHVGSKMLVYPDGRFSGSVGGGEAESRVIEEAKAAMADGKARKLQYSFVDPAKGDVGTCGGQVEVFVEPILPRATLVVIGGGHVGKAVLRLARWLGYRTVVSDDRPEFCTPEANPDADEFFAVPMSEIPERLPVNSTTFFVLTTRGTNVDVAGLPALLKTKPAFIGVIGSRRRWAMTRKALLDAGVDERVLNEVHSPLGLEINAETPEEIAVSIMAEIVMMRQGGTGKAMSSE